MQNKFPGKGAADVHPDYRTRQQHLDIIKYKFATQGLASAQEYWLSYCPRISKKAFNRAIYG